MATNVKWGAVSVFDAIPTATLNSFPSGTAAANHALGGAIDNTPAVLGAMYGVLEIVLASFITAAANTSPYINVWLIPSFDGTNYGTTNGSTGGAGPTQPGYFGGLITPPAGAPVKVMHVPLVLPPSLFKVQINSQLGVAWPASGNTCKLYAYGEQGS